VTDLVVHAQIDLLALGIDIRQRLVDGLREAIELVIADGFVASIRVGVARKTGGQREDRREGAEDERSSHAYIGAHLMPTRSSRYFRFFCGALDPL